MPHFSCRRCDEQVPKRCKRANAIVNSECDGRFCLYIQAYDAGARGYNVICVLVSGAAQLVNKLNGEDFNEADEQLFEVRT